MAEAGDSMEIAVCDDDELFLRGMEEQLKTLAIVRNVYLFSRLDTFLFSIDEGKRYDAVLMDIVWDTTGEGLNAATELYRLCPDMKIIYVTGYVEQFSQHIFLCQANLSGYLIKPVDPKLLEANLQKVAAALPFHDHPALVLRKGRNSLAIQLRKITFIESSVHHLKIHSLEEVETVNMRLEAILCSLPAGFCQCHKSFIVNLRQIKRFLPNEVLLKSGEKVPVSRSRYAGAKDAYFRFMGQSF
jgi:DNA-binding LytR/AlgR family response regulator